MEKRKKKRKEIPEIITNPETMHFRIKRHKLINVERNNNIRIIPLQYTNTFLSQKVFYVEVGLF